MNRLVRLASLAFVTVFLFAAASAMAAEPIKIGFGMALTGPLSPNGKMSLVAMQIWEDDINAAGGLLGRPVKLIYYDDQSSPSQVPSIYSKLIDVDKVDLIVSGYASTQIAAAMPVAIQKKKLFISLFGTGVNETIQLSEILLDDPKWADAEAGLYARFLQGGRGTKAEATDHRDRRWPMLNSGRTPAMARRRMRKSPDLK